MSSARTYNVPKDIASARQRIEKSEFDDIKTFAKIVDNHFLEKAINYFRDLDGCAYEFEKWDGIVQSFLNDYFSGLSPIVRVTFFMMYKPMTIHTSLYDIFVV